MLPKSKTMMMRSHCEPVTYSKKVLSFDVSRVESSSIMEATNPTHTGQLKFPEGRVRCEYYHTIGPRQSHGI